ncbi:MAG: J domain-containing protein [Pseudomonadota bacterium]
MSETAYPLSWPMGRPRTAIHRRQRARFDVTFARGRDQLVEEIRRLGGRYATLSTNVSLRRDGLPYANQPEPDDTGVAVYFEYKGQSMCFACDRWDKVKDNIRAIQKTIEAMRGIERWGTGEMLDRAISAFEALPAPGSRTWRDVLGLSGDITEQTVQDRWRELAAKHHPDTGGNADQMAAINKARDDALSELRA